MDEEFELVPKKTLKNLREENNNLIKKLNEVKGKGNENDFSKITKFLEDEKNKNSQNSQLLKKIDEKLNSFEGKFLKEKGGKNSKNSDNKTENLESVILSLTQNFTNYIDKYFENEKGMKNKLDKILEKNEDKVFNEIDIVEKIDKINDFLNNLKILLSQIKPNDIKIEENKS